MVSLSDGAMSVENAGQYYKQHYAAEYYIDGVTLGKGASALGLNGGVSAEQFDALLHGIDPMNGIQLRQKSGRSDEVERAGWDITLSPPKSISIQALVVGDTRLIEAHRQAVMRAIEEVETCALGRRGHGNKVWLQTGNVVAVMFEHHEARESIGGKHGPMPQLHHHVFVANLTQLPDGKWRGLEIQQIYKARGFIDAVYMSELARNVQQLGYRIERGTKGAFELTGFTREQVLAFSERAQDIERAELERGITDPRAARSLRLETRKAKGTYDADALKAEWESLATAQGIRLNHFPTQAIEPSIDFQVQAADSLDFAIRHTTAREAVVDQRELIATALKHRIGGTGLDELRTEITQAPNLIPEEPSVVHPLGATTTREMVRLEVENLRLVKNKVGKPVAGIIIRSAVDGTLSGTGSKEVQDWANAKGLLADQAEAAVLTLATPKWASAIEGLAGTTKTTTVGAIKEFAEDRDWTVRGFGTTTTSVNALEQAGIEAQTIAKALVSPLAPKTGCEIWFIDESSLLATRNVNHLLKLAKERGVERVVFVGDQKQHLAIEAGHPLRQFLTDNLAVAQLTTIRRQQDPILRHVIELIANEQIPEAVDELVRQHRVTAIPDIDERYRRIADEYLIAHEVGQRTLVVSPANVERCALNQAIRAKLINHGYVNSSGHEHQILIPKELTLAEQKAAGSYSPDDVIFHRSRGYMTVTAIGEKTLTLRDAQSRTVELHPGRYKYLRAYQPDTRTIAVGDRIEWREADGKRHIPNHMFGTITKLTGDEIQVKFDNGRQVSLPLAEARKIDLGYASTSHAGQGATVDRVIVNLDSRHQANQRQLYVSLSRSRIEAHLYTDDIERMRQAVQRKQEKSLALEVVQYARKR